MILVYTPHITNRIKYILNLIFKKIIGIEIIITTDKEELIKSNLPKINYSTERISNEPFIFAHNLVFENDIKQQKIEISNWEETKVLFETNNKNTFIPFDIFAASFFLVTRYEEYLPHTTDKYGRFNELESIAYKNNFHELPLINIWVKKFYEKLKNFYPHLKSNPGKYKFIPTIDIDNAYAYLHKDLFRTIGAFLKNLIYLDISNIFLRFKVILNITSDPFDTYSFIHLIHNKYNFSPLFFFLISKYGRYDRNVSYKNKKYQKLIREISEKYKIGIHPSFLSNKKIGILQKEIKILSEIINTPVSRSRQHFIKLQFPTTYMNLINSGIQEDYTMGYTQIAGFRASICTPFNFFNLKTNKSYNLIIYPFQIMDLTLNNKMKLTPEQAIEKIKNIIDKIKSVQGWFISLWHNQTFSNKGIWKGWVDVYEQMLKINCDILKKK